MEKRYTIKLFVNHKLTTQRAVNQSEVKKVVEQWKKRYALRYHNYEIYIYTPSKMNR
jgi:hypothetical protein